jgi:hypothetical protein
MLFSTLNLFRFDYSIHARATHQAGFSHQTPGFSPTLVHVGFVVVEVALL